MAKAKVKKATKANAASDKLWTAVRGKKVLLAGKFDFGVDDRLKHLTRAHGGTLSRDVTPELDYLVLPDVSGSKTLRDKANKLNAKGASINVIDADDYCKLVAPSEEELVAFIRRGGAASAANVFRWGVAPQMTALKAKPAVTIRGESFAGVDLRFFDFDTVAFEDCDFRRAKLDSAQFAHAVRCKFDQASLNDGHFKDVTDSTFRDAKLARSRFGSESSIDGVDFTGADLTAASVYEYSWLKKRKVAGVVFRNADLRKAMFENLDLARTDFRGAQMEKAYFGVVSAESVDFSSVDLSGAALNGCKLARADFSAAKLVGASLVDADLTAANFAGADVSGCNFRGASVAAAGLVKARGYQPPASDSVAGPALKALDDVVRKAKRIQFKVKLNKSFGERARYRDVIVVDTARLKYGLAVDVPVYVHAVKGKKGKPTVSGDLLLAAKLMPGAQAKLSTLEIKTVKSKIKAPELRGIIVSALCEMFGQTAPDASAFAKAAKASRAMASRQRQQRAASRKRIEHRVRKLHEAAKLKSQRKVEKKVAAAVGGKVADLESFMKALAVRADMEKIKKATAMLKAEKFQLFNDIADDALAGVVKSQTDPDLVYACRITGDGHFGCCTQNLNVCGGLRGSVCKHLLVLIIGLVQASKLDPANIDTWIAKTGGNKPELDKEKMGEIFVRYKGAEAGEIDWRPTETVPEDYYAL